MHEYQTTSHGIRGKSHSPSRQSRSFRPEIPDNSNDKRRFCRPHQLEPGKNRRRNYWDNAVTKPFFSSLKKKRIRKRVYKTRDLAQTDIFNYIEVFYNQNRRPSHLGDVSPNTFKGCLREPDFCLLFRVCSIRPGKKKSSVFKPISLISDGNKRKMMQNKVNYLDALKAVLLLQVALSLNSKCLSCSLI